MSRSGNYRSLGIIKLVGLLAVFLLAACGQDGDEANPGGNGEGGTLTVAQTGVMETLDPHTANTFQTLRALGLVYDSLLEVNSDLEVVPGLAKDYKYSNGGQTLTLTLREGLTFHDGTDLTAEDVKASLERILDEETGASVRSNFLSIDKVETPNETTVELRLFKADAVLPAALTSLNAAIVSQESIESETLDREPNGSGPFVFENYRQAQSFNVRAFDDYWGGRPKLDRVEFRSIADEPSVLAGMQAGSFDIGVLTDPSLVLQAEDQPNLTVERTPALSYHVLQLNSKRPPMDDKRVRQAISCAVDRQEIIDSAAFGEGQVTGPQVIPPFETKGDVTAGLPCDPPDVDAARKLLEDAGYGGGGIELNTIVMLGEYATAVDEAQSLKSQLAKIGVTLNLENLESNNFAQRWVEADFDAAVALNGGGETPDPHLQFNRYWSSEGNFQNVAAYSTDRIDDLLARGAAEADFEIRKEIYADVSELLLEASPWVWTFTGFEYRVLQEDVDGFEPSPTGSVKSLRETTLQ